MQYLEELLRGRFVAKDDVAARKALIVAFDLIEELRLAQAQTGAECCMPELIKKHLADDMDLYGQVFMEFFNSRLSPNTNLFVCSPEDSIAICGTLVRRQEQQAVAMQALLQQLPGPMCGDAEGLADLDHGLSVAHLAARKAVVLAFKLMSQLRSPAMQTVRSLDLRKLLVAAFDTRDVPPGLQAHLWKQFLNSQVRDTSISILCCSPKDAIRVCERVVKRQEQQALEILALVRELRHRGGSGPDHKRQ